MRQRRLAATRHDLIINDLLDGSLDEHSLLEAALVASGMGSRSELARHHWSIDRCVALANSQLNDASTPRDTAAAILLAIHCEILKGNFVDHCNNLATTLDRGDYNCVTATTVFQIVADRLALDSQVELLPQHVRCRLLTPNSNLIVETTDRHGLHPDDGQPAGRTITQAQLVGKLYYNRALNLLVERRFESALLHAELAWRLDPLHQEAGENVVIANSRWAIELAQAGEWSTAISLLRNTHSGQSSESTLVAAKIFVLQSWIESTCRPSIEPLSQPLAHQEAVVEQLLLTIAEHPTNSRLLQLLQEVSST